jgi:hypothetical protein
MNMGRELEKQVAIFSALFRAENEVKYTVKHGWEVTFYNLSSQQVQRLAEITRGEL